MFGRLLWKLLRGNRGRLTVALVAVISGAAVISALLNLQLDMERKLTQEFRQLGPNLVVTPGQSGPASEDSPQTVGPTAGPPPLMSESRVMSQIASAPKQGLVAAAPYLYMVARVKRHTGGGGRNVARPNAEARTDLEAGRKVDHVK